MNKLLIPFIIAFVLLSSSIMSGDLNKSRLIKWQESGTGVGELYFEGADFLDEFPGLPLYVHLFSIESENVGIDVKLSNAIWEDYLDVNAGGDVFNNLKGNLISRKSIIWIKKVPYAKINIIPFRKAGDRIQRLISFELDIDISADPNPVLSSLKQKKSAADFADNSVLATGSWYKIGVKSGGVHKLTYSDLSSMGFDVNSIDPRNIRIYGNGGGMLPEANATSRYDDLFENAIYVHGEDDGSFDASDYILFYGMSPQVWNYSSSSGYFQHIHNLYTDYAGYFVTVSGQTGKRIPMVAQSSLPVTNMVTKFQDYAYFEEEKYNLIKSGKMWFGEKYDVLLTQELPDFYFPNLDIFTPVYVRSSVAARSTSESRFNVVVDGVQIITAQVPPVPNSYNTDYAKMSIDDGTLTVAGSTIPVSLTYLPSSSIAVGWLDYVELNATRMLKMAGSQLSFRDVVSTGSGNITEFTIDNAGSSVRVWDVSNPLEPAEVELTSQNNTKSFKVSTDYLREFIAHDGSSYLQPDFLGDVVNQNLHALQPANLVILSHKAFLDEAHRLASFHNDHNNFSVIVLTPEEIYNEFSSGVPDITAVRDFARMLYIKDDGGENFRYFLIFGDGTYDPKDRVNEGKNLIPAFQSSNSLQPTGSYVTDDYFGLLDANEGHNGAGTLDIGIGRFPVETTDQATVAVDKVIRYVTNQSFVNNSPSQPSLKVPNFADWRNWLCFVADDEDGNLHLQQAEDLSNFVQQNYPVYNIDKIYVDTYQELTTPGGQRYPEVNIAINDRIAKGALIFNYTGHGGEIGLGHERFVEIADINSWTNTYNMPVFVTATCEFSRFDDPERTSAGELVFLNSEGGGISLFTTTRVSFSSSNFALNMNFYNRVFQKYNGEFLKMGDVIRLAKTPSNPNIRNFVLLGDPALQLAYPEFDVITTEVNGIPTGRGIDTLTALSKVTIKGEIRNDAGQLLEWFNGVLYPTVFDKPSEVVTRANDGGNPATYYLQKNILYKGKASVKNGKFTFSFVVPKDIAYKYGAGRISYYATNDTTDAHGYYEDMIIGGSNDNATPDNEGPFVELFMNDTNFVMGGITDENPVMLAFVSDLHGINTVGNGIGHDIVAILDGNTNQSIVLNDYYESDLDSYQNGVVRYPFFGLSNGLHTLEIKVWDVYNNSSSAYTEFVVEYSEDLVLNHLYNYPNPFTETTSFIFEHNQPGEELDIEIRIYSLNGQMVREIKENVSTNGYRTNPINWDGTSYDGAKLSAGFYVYKVRVNSGNGFTKDVSNKLILVK